jgi:hypothetical protein
MNHIPDGYLRRQVMASRTQVDAIVEPVRFLASYLGGIELHITSADNALPEDVELARCKRTADAVLRSLTRIATTLKQAEERYHALSVDAITRRRGVQQ